MANITFVQRLWYEYPGVEILSAILKNGGHNVRLIINESPHKMIRNLRPNDIVAFSVMTGMHHWALKTASSIKDNIASTIIFGGAHPTYFPEIINERGVDIICRGEGENALLDLANAVDNKNDFTGIANLWVKKEGKIYKNPLRRLINVDSLPFPDRSLYYEGYPSLKNNPHKIFLAGRGCPFECSFCFNEKLKTMYNGLGEYVRLRDPANIINEIKSVRQNYPLKTVFFNDDILILNRKWVKEFLYLYKKEIGLPFYATARADTISEDIVTLLSGSGCKGVSFAIESGNEAIRNGMLCKNISNEKIREAALILHKHGIKLTTYNMIGMPGETLENAFQTVDINIKIKADYPRCSFLTPYPGTRIAEYASRTGHLDSSPDSIPAFSQQSISIIKSKNKNEFANIHSFFQTMVLFPRLIPFIRVLIKLPANILFRAWWAFVYMIVFSKSEGRSIKDMLTFAIRSSRSLLEKGS